MRGALLLLHENPDQRALLHKLFVDAGTGLEIMAADSVEAAVTLARNARPDVVVAALPPSHPENPAAVVAALRSADPDLPVILLHQAPDAANPATRAMALAAQAMEAGATDILTLGPVDLVKLPILARRAVEHARSLRRLSTLPAAPDARLPESDIPGSGANGHHLATIAHDLRSPLAGLTALLDLMQAGADGALPPAASHRVRRIRTVVDRLAQVTEQISDLALAETGRLPVLTGSVDIASTMLAARHRLEPTLRSSAVTLEVTVPPGLPRVLGDTIRVGQVITSLVTSLLKLSEGTTLELTAAHKGAFVEVSLREEPHRGLPVEALPPGFERRARSAGQSGLLTDGAPDLGLSIAGHLVRLQGGRLLTGSEAESGILAVFTLPCEPELSRQHVEPAHEIRPRS